MRGTTSAESQRLTERLEGGVIIDVTTPELLRLLRVRVRLQLWYWNDSENHERGQYPCHG